MRRQTATYPRCRPPNPPGFGRFGVFGCQWATRVIHAVTEAVCLRAGRRSAWPFPEDCEDRGTCAQFRESRMRHISSPRTSFRSLGAERHARIWACHIGRGWMTTGSTKPDAKHFSACAFVIARPPAARLARTDCASGAPSLNLLAAHGATQRSPVRRARAVGARRPGAQFNGYQKNAGGWHPPGRNPDCRQQR